MAGRRPLMENDGLWLAGRRILFLSPHADDVAYSLGGLVARLAGKAHMSLLTVFGRSRWALPHALRRAGEDTIGRARSLEDQAFAARHGLGLHCLDLPDASCCGYDGDSELRVSPESDPRFDATIVHLQAHLHEVRVDMIVAPAAIGGHVDHRIVFEAARRFGSADLLFYEDIPYAAAQPLRDIEQALTGRGMTPMPPIGIADVLETKTSA